MNSAGKPIDPSAMGKVWRIARERAFAATPRLSALTAYELRHAGVAMMLRAGVPVPRISQQVGNSPAVLMKHYARVMTTDDATFRDMLGRALLG